MLAYYFLNIEYLYVSQGNIITHLFIPFFFLQVLKLQLKLSGNQQRLAVTSRALCAGIDFAGFLVGWAG